jgi:hypothetical protein
MSPGSVSTWHAVPLEEQGANACSLSTIKLAAPEGLFACVQQHSSTLQQYACSKGVVRNATAAPIGHVVCFTLSVGCLFAACRSFVWV